MGREATFAIIAAITGDALRPRFTDYAGSVQAVMATDTLLSALVAQGHVPDGAANAIRADINSAYRAVNDPNAYDPGGIPGQPRPSRGGNQKAAMKQRKASTIAIAALLLASCSGGGSSGGSATPDPGPPTPGQAQLYTAPAQLALTAAEVERIIAQGAAEAQARGLPATFAVVDRVGNVLAVFRDDGRQSEPQRPGQPERRQSRPPGTDRAGGAVAGAIAKAITGAYLSSSGNAFSTRTASQIVQQHFPPSAAARGPRKRAAVRRAVQPAPLLRPLRPLRRRSSGRSFIGPKRSPLGLSADPGGFPLYKSGVVVGGIGVMGDGVYGFDPEIQDVDADPEEAIALAATIGFDAPDDIRANRITVDGTALRYSDVTAAGLQTNPASAPAFATRFPAPES